MIKRVPTYYGVNCKLDDTAILRKAAGVAKVAVELANKRQQLKETCLTLRDEIKELEAEQKNLLEQIQTRNEFLPNQPVFEIFDSETKTVQVLWKETIVNTRKISEKEYNNYFNNVFTNDKR